ncbi:MAG: DMT family transporter [Candidatus Wallbacteria bacterium]
MNKNSPAPAAVNIKFYSLILILLNVVWGGTYVASKIPLAEIKPFTLAFVRFAIASVVMVPFLFTRYKKVRLSPREVWTCSKLGAVGITAAYIFQNVGLKYTQSINAALEITCEPIIILIFGVLFLKEKLTSSLKTGMFLSTIGVLFIILPPAIEDSAKQSAEAGAVYSSLFGDILVLSSAACSAIYTIMGRKIIHRVPSFVVSSYAFITGTIFLFPFALYENNFSALPAASFRTWACILYLAVLATSISYFAWYHILEKLSASYMSIFLNLQPLFGIIFSSLILSEPLTKWLFIGGILIISGVYKATPQDGNTEEASTGNEIKPDGSMELKYDFKNGVREVEN